MSGGLGGRPHTARSNSWQQAPVAAVGAALHGHHGRIFTRQAQKPWSLFQLERCSPRVFRVIGSRRLGMGLATLLALVSFFMLISYASLISFGHTQDVEERSQQPITAFLRSLEKKPEEISGKKLSRQHLGKRSIEETSEAGGWRQARDLNRTAPQEVSFMVDDLSLPLEHPCQDFTLPPPPADPKRTGPRPCPVCYLPVDQAIAEMKHVGRSDPGVLKQLSYVTDLNVKAAPFGEAGSEFGGHPSLADRESSFKIKDSMHVYCGFVKGRNPGVGTGFDISADDLADMKACKGIVVASAIFGNYDQMQQPKNISKEAKKKVCFFMFIDEETAYSISEDGTIGTPKKIGLWRVVVVHNLPYADARRNGKVPKLLIHRLFPNAQYSLWVDGKLELVVDPYQILERFLWRSKDVFAISKHYKRFDVFEEAEANKAAGKYDNVSINSQIEFYRQEGLTPYSSAKLPIVSDVPEGCVIIREHTPLTNLFSCLWFNEVDRFTSRDQLSFGVVRDKIMSQARWRASMFLDCERRNFVVQGYHRDLLEQRLSFQNTQNLTTDSDQAALPEASNRRPVLLETPVHSSPKPRSSGSKGGPSKPKRITKRRHSKGEGT